MKGAYYTKQYRNVFAECHDDVRSDEHERRI